MFGKMGGIPYIRGGGGIYDEYIAEYHVSCI